MECYCYLRNVQDLLADGKTLHERRFGEPFKGPVFPLGAMVEHYPISARDESRLHQYGKKVLPGIFLGYALIAVEFGKDTFWSQTLRNWKNMNASEIHPRRINAKEVLISHRREEFIFPVADGTAKLSERDNEFREPTRRREQTVRSEDLSGGLQGEPVESQPTESKDDAEARSEFWSIQGDFIYRHHNEPHVQHSVPKEETFPFRLKYVDVTRSTYTDLDVMQEKRIDDYCNVDENRSLSDSWKRFTKFTSLKKKPPKGKMWSGRRLTKVQATTRPENLWPEVWFKMGKAAQ